MRKTQWAAALFAVGLLLGATSVASAIDLTTTYEMLVPVTSTDVTTISFDYTSGSDGFNAGARRIRVYGYYDGNEPGGSNETSQWMMPCKFETSHPDGVGTPGDWFHVDTDYGPYYARLGDSGFMNTVHHFEIKLNRFNGLFEWRVDGTKLSFWNRPGDTNNPQPDGGLYNPSFPEALPYTFFADEEIDPSTIDPAFNPDGDYYGLAHAAALGWLGHSPEWCDEYGVGGAGEYYLIFDAESGASVNNIRPGILGDANLDGTVDDKDASVLGANWLGTGKVFTQGDFNLDGTVDDMDAAILAANWGTTASLPHPDDPAEGGAVPEPSTWCLLAGALAMLAGWRRKR